jgi:hypothetical protein
MAKYTMPWNAVSSSAGNNTFKTIAGVLAADAVGDQFRITKLVIGSAKGAPADGVIAVRIMRIEDVLGGTFGTAGVHYTEVGAAAIGKKDPLSILSPVTGAHTFTSEPITYDTSVLYAMEFNDRTGLIQEWDPDDAHIFRRNNFAGILIAPRTGIANFTSGVIEFEMI